MTAEDSKSAVKNSVKIKNIDCATLGDLPYFECTLHVIVKSGRLYPCKGFFGLNSFFRHSDYSVFTSNRNTYFLFRRY